MKPISAGTKSFQKTEEKRPTIVLNLMAMLLIALVLGVGGYFYSLRPSLYFVVGMPLETFGFLAVIWLNQKKRYFDANLLMLSVNAIFVAYWSTVLGAGISVELLLLFIAVIIFHLGSAFFLYERSGSLLAGIIACVIIGAWMIVNAHYHFLKPINLTAEIAFIMRWFTNIALLVFILAVMLSYASQIKSVMAELRRQTQASERKSRFIQDVFHEVRTPMNAIFSIAQLMELRKNDYNAKEKVEIDQLYDSCDLAHSIINNVLDYERIESGQFYTIKKEAISLRDCISRCVAAHSYIAASRGIQIEVSIDNKLDLPIQSDRLALTKIFNNLFSNAVKFANSNSQIDFECFKLQDRIIFCITNKGVIAPEIAGRLFQRFASDREQVAGSGLGLNIIKHLIELLEGSIVLDTKDFGSTTFRFSLPYEAGIGKVDRQLRFKFKRNCYWGAKALILEDDKMAAVHLGKLLTEMGVQTVMCYGGEAALDLIRTEKPNIVISDLGMEGYNCKDFIQQLQHDDELKDIPFLVVSGDAFKKDELLASGACGFITKPVRIEELHGQLARQLPHHLFS